VFLKVKFTIYDTVAQDFEKCTFYVVFCSIVHAISYILPCVF
jgi:hypothetical protein